MVFSLLVLAIAPGLALVLFFYLRDRYNREPIFPLILTFLLGALVIVPSMFTSYLIQVLTGWSSRSGNLFELALVALVVAGLVEESWKFLVVRFYAYDRPEFDEPYDGIMYSVMAALGFATVENVLYVVSRGLGTGLLRALLAVPGHAFYGVLLGYFLGAAKFAHTRVHSNLLTLTGFGLAVLAHGVYNFIVFALDQRPLLILVLPVFVVLAWVFFFEATRRRIRESPFRHPKLAALHRGEEVEPDQGRAEEPGSDAGSGPR